MRHLRMLLVLVPLLAAIGVAYAATIQTSTVQLTGLPNVYVTSQGPSGSTVTVEASPKGGSTKKAFVHKVVIGGQTYWSLIRFEITSRGIYSDIVSDATVSSLSTTVLNMSLTTPSHPSAAKDTADTEALVAAGGS